VWSTDTVSDGVHDPPGKGRFGGRTTTQNMHCKLLVPPGEYKRAIPPFFQNTLDLLHRTHRKTCLPDRSCRKVRLPAQFANLDSFVLGVGGGIDKVDLAALRWRCDELSQNNVSQRVLHLLHRLACRHVVSPYYRVAHKKWNTRFERSKTLPSVQ